MNDIDFAETKKSEAIMVRLSPETKAALDSYAKRRGVKPSAVARILIERHLEGEGKKNGKKA